MISLVEAQQRVLALAKAVEAETLPLHQALGRFAINNIVAVRSQPARDISAMDGYALKVSDGANRRHVVGESAAGAAFAGALEQNEAVRIFTGAALPEGADCVVIQENITRAANEISLLQSEPLKSGANIRSKGADFLAGDVLVARGQRLTAARLGLIAAGGHAAINVRRSVRVALISTGDELVQIGTGAGPDELPASNALMLAAMLADLPVIVEDLGIANDSVAAIADTILAAAPADIIVTIGGASVGDYDLVRPALAHIGAQINFWKVAMRPGKPLVAGQLGGQVILGLPGNPVSAFVTALLFLKPLVAQLSGATAPLPPTMRYPLAADLPANGARTDHLRASFEIGGVKPLSSQDSAGLSALAHADALIVRQPNAPPAKPGDLGDVILI